MYSVIHISNRSPHRLPVSLRFLACSALFFLSVKIAFGQPPRVYRDRVEPHWFSDGQKFWYQVSTGPDQNAFILVDANTGMRLPAFDHQQVAERLSKLLTREIPASRLPVQELEFPDDNSVLLKGPDGTFRLNVVSGELKQEAGIAKESDARLFLPVRPSRSGGSDTEIVVTNATDAPIQLLWINTGGQRQSYGNIEPGQTRRQHTFSGHCWLLAFENNEPIGCLQATDTPAEIVINADTAGSVIRRGPRNGRGRRPQADVSRSLSPDESLKAFVRDNNLWIESVASNASERQEQGTPDQKALTTDATSEMTFRLDRSRERLVGMAYDREDGSEHEADVRWSPDSGYLIALQTQRVMERRVHYIESSPADGLQPQLRSYPYLKPGDAVPVSWPRLFRRNDDGQFVEIEIERDLIANPWQLQFLRFDESDHCYWLYNERGHQTLRVLELTLSTGRIRTVVDEHSDTFIHYSSSGKFELHWLSDGRLIWASERTGWNHLYLYDVASGTVRNAITTGDWNVRRIEKIDEQNGVIWFYAVGTHPGQDPYHEHFCCVNLDGSGFAVLTDGDGTHQIDWSPDRTFFLDRYSRVDLPPVTELRSADGALVCRLEEADASETIAFRGGLPERFVAKGRDGKTDIWGIIHRPRNFDANKQYPVIENIYAGPHDHHVPKAFRSSWGHQHSIADEGAIVVQIDGMGTAWRSKAFHDVCFRNLKDAGFPDRIAWMTAAAARYPEMDVSRVGIYGGSAGGQNAMAALLWFGDFYDVAVADCGCHDNRMDKIWWNEQWMGYPVGEHYAASSNMEHADQLQGHLMLIVGELDRNVDPASTTQVVGRLIRAGKDFDYVYVVGAGHGAGETPWASARRLRFFTEHLAMETSP
ncbi:MAG: prolyl oligopeptidase family serine peptidase [Planctomycetaceae bacterium]|nr:prolyl oligopeptidase family serine peptidase [Planctomycetaceae bacterium]